MAESFKRFSTVFSSSWIDIGTSWDMNKVIGGTQKLQIERGLVARDGLGCGIAFQALLKNPFNGVNIELFEVRSEEHTSELQSRRDLVCRLLLEKKKIKKLE